MECGLSPPKTKAPEDLPGFLALHERGLLAGKAEALRGRLRSCTLCPRECRVDRMSGQKGACGVADRPKVAAMSIHPWEEPPLSGSNGSGTIFFSGCTLSCVFCQNFPISQLGVGREMEVKDLAEGMADLQRRGAHNLNLVTSTHQMAAVVEALVLAASRGFRLPVVYNTSGYEHLETLRLLDGIVDIYLPDIKYADPEAARKYSGRADYVIHNRAALVEMWRQVGPLRMDEEGVAVKGMLVRHLVLPDRLSGSLECLRFLAGELGPEVWVSLMNQYFPAHLAHDVTPLDRKTTEEEYAHACSLLNRFGLENGFVQSSCEDS